MMHPEKGSVASESQITGSKTLSFVRVGLQKCWGGCSGPNPTLGRAYQNLEPSEPRTVGEAPRIGRRGRQLDSYNARADARWAERLALGYRPWVSSYI